MDLKDRDRWNEKYKQGWRTSLNATLLRFYQLASKGKALDIACGSGDNSIFLAEKGFSVDAFDISDEAIKIANALALKRGVKVNLLMSDIESFPFKGEYYDLIINFYFLDRNSFSKITASLKQGGLLIFETYNEKHLLSKPSFNRSYLLREGELRKVFKELEIVYYEEASNITTLVAKKSSTFS